MFPDMREADEIASKKKLRNATAGRRDGCPRGNAGESLLSAGQHLGRTWAVVSQCVRCLQTGDRPGFHFLET